MVQFPRYAFLLSGTVTAVDGRYFNGEVLFIGGTADKFPVPFVRFISEKGNG